MTVLRMRDFDGNEMNGIVWNARVQDELAEKLVPGGPKRVELSFRTVSFICLCLALCIHSALFISVS